MQDARDTAQTCADTPAVVEIDTTETEEKIRRLKAAGQVMSALRFDGDALVDDIHELIALVADLIDEGVAEMEQLCKACLQSDRAKSTLVSWAKEAAS